MKTIQHISSLTLTVIFLSGCFETVRHDHTEHAMKAQKYITEAILLEDSLDVRQNKSKYIDLMKKAIQESKMANRADLNVFFKGWGDMFHDNLIKGAQLTIEGDTTTNIQMSFEKLTLATEHINRYSEWVTENQQDLLEKLNNRTKPN